MYIHVRIDGLSHAYLFPFIQQYSPENVEHLLTLSAVQLEVQLFALGYGHFLVPLFQILFVHVVHRDSQHFSQLQLHHFVGIVYYLPRTTTTTTTTSSVGTKVSITRIIQPIKSMVKISYCYDSRVPLVTWFPRYYNYLLPQCLLLLTTKRHESKSHTPRFLITINYPFIALYVQELNRIVIQSIITRTGF